MEVINGKGWWVHWLNPELAYCSLIQFSSFSLFSLVAGNGRTVGVGVEVSWLGSHMVWLPLLPGCWHPQ